MRNRLFCLCLCSCILLLNGCGFHLRGSEQLPSVFHQLQFDTHDPYGPLARAIRTEMRLNNIEIINDGAETEVPSLRILSSEEQNNTISIYRTGAAAEYQLVLLVNAQVLMPNRDLYPIQVKIYRSFLDNPRAALAKDAEQEMIREEMRQQAAQQLMRKLLAVASAEKQSP